MSAIAAAQAGALITRVREDASRRDAELRVATRRECETIRRQARAEARAAIRAAIAEKRRRILEHCHAVDLENESTQRAAAFARARRLADRALAGLPTELARRWRDESARRRWCEATVATASRVLRSRDWFIELPAGSTTADRECIAALVLRHGVRVGAWSDCGATAGLRIGHGGTWVDATAERLLADRTELAARFLAELSADGASA